MEASSSSPPPPPPRPQPGCDMEIHHPPVTSDWDWGDLLDFTVDDQFPLSFDTVGDVTQTIDNPTSEIESQHVQVPVSDRVRKRDPRLTCSNFLAGLIPCACPEMDALLLEEESAMPGKKRVRVARAGWSIARCQVPGCEVDISELKGYHRRHRVCLGCANATAVALDGQTKRYCQQCGKFHVLSDFDEGKRSCRRKLERHNNRRRRKPAESSKGGAGDKEVQGDLPTEDTTCDAEAEKKDGMCSSGQMVEKEGLVESEDGHNSNLHSDPNSQNVNSDSGVSFTVSGDAQIDGGKDDSKFSISPSHCDNKSTYSSMCPTGRISFKLYDWNPAEFPRRLRHQIFQWLASMPVELEGYIRPGCTILTAFIAMPTFMWVKLFEDPVSYLNNLLGSGKMLSKKGRMRVYLNNMIFNVTEDGNSVKKVNVEGHAPRLHYVHPTCFEAGKPIEFDVCGSFGFCIPPDDNSLAAQLQAKNIQVACWSSLEHLYHILRMIIVVALPQVHTKGGSGLNHQLYKILTSCIEPNLLGPAFIERRVCFLPIRFPFLEVKSICSEMPKYHLEAEVENESGLSNFIPVLIGDREICSEMKIIQQRLDASHSFGAECEVSTTRQMAFSDFITDIAWFLKEPSAENSQQTMTSFQIQRINSLLNFLLHHESIIILVKILKSLKIMMNKMEVDINNGTSDANMRLLQSYMDYASNILHEKLERSEVLKHHLEYSGQENNCISGSCCGSDMSSGALSSENLGQRPSGGLAVVENSNSIVRSDELPLLNRDVVMTMNLINERPKKSCGFVFSNKVLKYRPSVFVIAIIAVCFGVCAILLHPHKVSKLAVSIRRLLFLGAALIPDGHSHQDRFMAFPRVGVEQWVDSNNLSLVSLKLWSKDKGYHNVRGFLYKLGHRVLENGVRVMKDENHLMEIKTYIEKFRNDILDIYVDHNINTHVIDVDHEERIVNKDFESDKNHDTFCTIFNGEFKYEFGTTKYEFGVVDDNEEHFSDFEDSEDDKDENEDIFENLYERGQPQYGNIDETSERMV
ncbi:unnamed protein product [Dovyalis caffra]|uniref:SBP-type domain-containing protein n=1 Tax=Dovyalis caffra TaxID=77055 RepID=A0AAV1RF64_9ROSI|nr:unnamed protein product [Dovyalis caffra]